MKSSVIFLVLLVVSIPISYAEVIDIPGVTKPNESLEGYPSDGPGEGDSNIKRFIYAGDSILASVGDSEINYYHQGRLSNRLSTDSSGGVVGEFLSLPFGQKVVNSGVDYPFTGKEEDESGLYYFGARYYDDNLGRFTSVDPVEENHAYSYVRNNPMNRVDPSGMSDTWDDELGNVNTYRNFNIGVSALFALGQGIYRGDPWQDIARNTIVAAAMGYASFEAKLHVAQSGPNFLAMQSSYVFNSIRENAIANEPLTSNIRLGFSPFNFDIGADGIDMSLDVGKAFDVLNYGISSCAKGGKIDWLNTLHNNALTFYLPGSGDYSGSAGWFGGATDYYESRRKATWGHEAVHLMQLGIELPALARGSGFDIRDEFSWGKKLPNSLFGMGLDYSSISGSSLYTAINYGVVASMAPFIDPDTPFYPHMIGVEREAHALD